MDAPQYQRALELYLSISDLDPAARARDLAERCGDDEVVRVWVERLLRDDRRTVDGFGSLDSDVGIAFADEPGAGLTVGDVVRDRYEVVAWLGQGATASVFRVRDVELGQDLALKVLQHSHPLLRRRMVREQAFQGQIVHRNVVSVRDLLDVDGQLGLLMELVDGPSLGTFLGSERPPDDVVDALALGLLAGVQAIHDAGIVHRDIKPDNVLIANTRGQIVPKLTDFGIARDPSSDGASLTQTGALVGTLSTMSPEQIRASRKVDARSDVWAVGCVLYRIVSGHDAFVGADNGALITAVLEGRRAPLPDDLPARWRDAIEAALQLSAEDRPADCVELRRRWEAPGGLILGGGSSRRSPARPRHRFVGRQRALSDLSELLGRERLITVLGVGGLGKTRLVREIGRQQRASFPGGIWFVPLAEVRSLDGILSAVARTFRVPLRDESPRDQVIRMLSRHEGAIVVLDNFEQLVEHARDTVGAWLDAVPGLRVLVTSRAPLRLYGEVHYPLDLLDEDEAVELFVDRAERQGARVATDPEERAVLVELVEQLDCLPLAIELAAARARLLSPRALLQRMTRRFDVLATRSPDLPERHQTLRTTLEWSWELLDASEQQALQQLSVFDGGFTLEAAEAVVDLGDDAVWVEDVLAELSDKSLLVVQADRLRLLVSVREFAAEQLVEPEPVEMRHAAWFAELAAGAAWEQDPEEELGNFVAAASRAGSRGDEDIATPNALAAARILFRRGPLRSAAALLEPLVERTEAPAHRAALLGSLGRVRAASGDWTEGFRLLDRAISLARSAGASYVLVSALVLKAGRNLELGRFDEAEALLAQAEDVAEREGAPQGIQRVLGTQAIIASYRGDYERAEALYQRQLDILRGAPASRAYSGMLGRYGHLKSRRGDHDEARRLFVRALAMADELGDLALRAMWLGSLARLSDRLGEVPRAVAFAEEAIQTVHAHGERNGVATWEGLLASTHARAGRYALAERHFERAIEAATATGRRMVRYKHRVGIAYVRLQQGRLEEAERILVELRTEGEALSPLHQSLGSVIVHLGSVYERTGRPDEAQRAFADAAQVARSLRDPIIEAQVIGLRASYDEDLVEARAGFDASVRGLRAVDSAYQVALMQCRRALYEIDHGDLDAAGNAIGEARRIAARFEVQDNSELPRVIRESEAKLAAR
ncbi:MAG: tetratricopeptide repeat protein [Myxococcota bacterium]